jgi:hypothetical protein
LAFNEDGATAPGLSSVRQSNSDSTGKYVSG